MPRPLVAAVALVLAAGLSAAAPAAAAPADLVVAGDGRGATAVGPLRPRLDATRAAAIRAFGPAYAVGRQCRYAWRGLGLTVLMENLGATGGPCAYAQVAYVSGANAGRWRTARGLRVGMSLPVLRRLYPAATRHGTYWWVVRGFLPGVGPYGVISARVVGGRVVALRVWIGGAGE
jgi:hypothetical protein